jgi:hypothetical protein
MSNTNNPSETTSTVIPETVGEIQKSLKLVKTSRLDKFQGCTVLYCSTDSLSSFFIVFIWEIPKDQWPNSEYGFEFMYSVEKSLNGTKVATGYAETLNEACEQAWYMRRSAFHDAVHSYDSPKKYKQTLEQAIAKKR